jgi:biotin synthesis protein BioG
MKQQFITQRHRKRLLLFFAGWGADAHPFAHLCPSEADLLICYDYRTLCFDYALLQPYEELHVVGWSMGVWAATQVLGRAAAQQLTLPKITASVALNGTPRPIDDHYGIPVPLYQATLDNLSAASLVKFRRRMCGSAEAHRTFMTHCPQRPPEELGEELAAIQQLVADDAAETRFAWKRAIVGTADAIVPPGNQWRFWTRETPAPSAVYADTDGADFRLHRLDIPHYHASTLTHLLQE